MFVNRARKRKRNAFLLIIALILVSAFGFGYYLNYGGNTNVNKDNTSQGEEGYKIPGSIRNPGAAILIPNADPGTQEDQSTNANQENLVTPTTKIIFKTYFTLCSHMVDKDAEDMKEFINLSEAELKNKFSDWSINEFSTQQVILKREIQTYCPRHFIISSKDGYIAIYVYNNDGVRTMYKMTEDPVSILTIEDQSSLKFGIVADSEEELLQKLEGLSD